MVNDNVGTALVMALVLILPISALAARRLPLATTAKYAAAWVAIFLVALLIVREFT